MTLVVDCRTAGIPLDLALLNWLERHRRARFQRVVQLDGLHGGDGREASCCDKVDSRNSRWALDDSKEEVHQAVEEGAGGEGREGKGGKGGKEGRQGQTCQVHSTRGYGHQCFGGS